VLGSQGPSGMRFVVLMLAITQMDLSTGLVERSA
jgi:hypothetical protein